MHPRTSELLDKVRTTLHERGNHYGSARTNHERISELWTGYLGDYISPMQVAMCMLLVKVSRLQESENHIDSIEDILGYAAIYHTLLSELEDEYDFEKSE